jgi:hypothetical protein
MVAKLTCHVESPGLRLREGMSDVTSTSCIAPFVATRTAATTASFSIGLNVHVEYTSLPPTCTPAFSVISQTEGILYLCSRLCTNGVHKDSARAESTARSRSAMCADTKPLQ